MIEGIALGIVVYLLASCASAQINYVQKNHSTQKTNNGYY